jgi:hypothetical protein
MRHSPFTDGLVLINIKACCDENLNGEAEVISWQTSHNI